MSESSTTRFMYWLDGRSPFLPGTWTWTWIEERAQYEPEPEGDES